MALFSFSRLSRFAIAFACIGSLSACGYYVRSAEPVSTDQNWQRTTASSPGYMLGPKAQQILHRDISYCVVELRELERLGAIENAVPSNSRVYSQKNRRPQPVYYEGDRILDNEKDIFLSEDTIPYHNYEECMARKGWERVEKTPPVHGLSDVRRTRPTSGDYDIPDPDVKYERGGYVRGVPPTGMNR